MNDEKEEYREKIIEMVDSIKDIKILIYLDTFIKEIIKAEWLLCLYIYKNLIIGNPNKDNMINSFLSFTKYDTSYFSFSLSDT